jgi:hypothetical protein
MKKWPRRRSAQSTFPTFPNCANSGASARPFSYRQNRWIEYNRKSLPLTRQRRRVAEFVRLGENETLAGFRYASCNGKRNSGVFRYASLSVSDRRCGWFPGPGRRRWWH